ncbi:MAG: lipoprotein insertase outer membrane protein LolB [Thiotrichaceae bacterium]
MKYWLVLSLGLLVLSGCSTATRQIPDTTTGNSGSQNKSWKARQAKLAALSMWKLKGRASVAYRGDNWPFGLEWQQTSPSHYSMNIKHPLTQSSLAQVVKTGNVVRLTSNGRVYQDSSAEKLIEKNLRVKLPVKGMRHWVLGVASPHYPVTTLKLDSTGRPLLLQQAGWNIHYLKYQTNTFNALPSLINVTRESPQPVQIKIRIRQWN